MKALGLILLSTLITISAQANWELISESTEKGVTPYGVKTILNSWEYRDLFEHERKEATHSLLAGEPVRVIAQIEVNKMNFLFF